jgi:hypothetical protein
MSSGGSPPSGADKGEGCHYGETYGQEFVELAYKGLEDIVPQNRRVVKTTPSTCYALCVYTGVVTNFISFHFKDCIPTPLNYGGRSNDDARCSRSQVDRDDSRMCASAHAIHVERWTLSPFSLTCTPT